MNERARWMALGLIALSLAPSCGGEETSGNNDDDDGSGAAAGQGPGGSGGAGGASGEVIPDPGTIMAETTWIDDGLGHGTPGTAQPIGIVNTSPGYVEGDIDPVTGTFWYVFRTGPALTSFTANLFATTAEIDFVHLHDGNGLVLGPEITPSQMTSPVNQTWPVVPDHVYLLEVHAPGGGFF